MQDSQKGYASQEAVIALACLSLLVDKLLHRQRTRGSVASLPASGGRLPLLDAEGLAQLTVCPAQQPDATLDELRTSLAAIGGPALSRTTIWWAVEGAGWGRKKSVHAAERDSERVVGLRQHFLETLAEQDVTRFVFVDETSMNLTYCRRYG